MNQEAGKCWALVPAYRPDGKLLRLAEELAGSGSYGRVLVVDDGSPAECAPIFEALAGMPSVTVLRHAVNRGKGQALKTGLNHYLLESDPGSPGIVTCDADGQHLPADIGKVCARGAEEGRFTLGVRDFGQGTPWKSLAGNVVTRVFFALFTGLRVKDTQTGLRFIPRRMAGFFIQVPYDRFDYEFAALIDASSELKGAILQVPIETVYIDGNASSHYRPFRDSLTVCTVFLRFLSLSVTTALLDYLTFIAVFYASRELLASFIAARAVSIVYNFHFARTWVFKARSDFLRQLAKYLGLVLLFMCISYGFTWAVSQRLPGFELLAKAVAEGALFFFSFVIQRRFIMVKEKPEIS
ncbi:MAG: bifunctional glycosyltransferase family 2/GtrA family protein [Deltaproteobacteria bacterium]|jgi:putative flippase GtrA|nr:bifunctional glycosyltransferase family 2/GtrA family protein [Deltaproteobacteria bacterium]